MELKSRKRHWHPQPITKYSSKRGLRFDISKRRQGNCATWIARLQHNSQNYALNWHQAIQKTLLEKAKLINQVGRNTWRRVVVDCYIVVHFFCADFRPAPELGLEEACLGESMQAKSYVDGREHIVC
jgi:hypothetical protein